jgi:hypothetical protein
MQMYVNIVSNFVFRKGPGRYFPCQNLFPSSGQCFVFLCDFSEINWNQSLNVINESEIKATVINHCKEKYSDGTCRRC